MTRALGSLVGATCDHDGCLTCGDTAVPLTVREVRRILLEELARPSR